MMKGFLGTLCALFCIFSLAQSGETVKNGIQPRGQAITFEFTEDLRFGGGQEEHLLWVGPTVSLSINSKGHIFIADPAEFRILEFKPDGEFIRSFGAQGQGPGEFQNLAGFNIMADDSAVAVDLLGGIGKLVYFNPDMSFDRDKSPVGFGTMIQSVLPSPSGELYHSVYVELNVETGRMNICSGILDTELNRINVISSVERSAPNIQRFNDGQYWSEYLGENLKITQSFGVANFTPQGRILTALTDVYTIQIWDPTGQTLERTVTRKHKPISNPDEEIMAFTEPTREAVIQALPTQFKSLITENVVKKAIELAEFPPFKNPVFSIVPLPDEGFLVVHDVSFVKHESRADIFSGNGEFLGHFTLPHLGISGGSLSPRWIFRDRYAYVLDLTEDSENVFVRYTYRRVPM